MQKKMMIRIFLGMEVLIFGWLYYYGARGVQAVHYVRKENEEIVQKIAQLQQEVETIDQQISAWNTNPFFKEKLAREQLSMSKSGDEIYFYD